MSLQFPFSGQQTYAGPMFPPSFVLQLQISASQSERKFTNATGFPSRKFDLTHVPCEHWKACILGRVRDSSREFFSIGRSISLLGSSNGVGTIWTSANCSDKIVNTDHWFHWGLMQPGQTMWTIWMSELEGYNTLLMWKQRNQIASSAISTLFYPKALISTSCICHLHHISADLMHSWMLIMLFNEIHTSWNSQVAYQEMD